MFPSLWTAVYLIESEGIPQVEMLFTVATGEADAEVNFHSDLDVRFAREGISDLAPEKIADVSDFDESVGAMVRRLMRLGYKFVMPVREQLPDDKVGAVVYTFLNMHRHDDDQAT